MVCFLKRDVMVYRVFGLPSLVFRFSAALRSVRRGPLGCGSLLERHCQRPRIAMDQGWKVSKNVQTYSIHFNPFNIISIMPHCKFQFNWFSQNHLPRSWTALAASALRVVQQRSTNDDGCHLHPAGEFKKYFPLWSWRAWTFSARDKDLHSTPLGWKTDSKHLFFHVNKATPSPIPPSAGSPDLDAIGRSPVKELQRVSDV